jgi:hypothetical protein
MNKTYTRWSDNFKELKAESKFPEKSDICRVIRFYKNNPPPMDSLRNDWKHDLGFRKNVADGIGRGEQEIERLLLGEKGTEKTIHIKHKSRTFEVRVTEQNFPFACNSKGQVISDAFGYYKKGAVYHPVAIEVKVNDGTPWFAVVENLIQIRMARRNLEKIEQHGRTILGNAVLANKVRGTWGLIIAPEKYYKKHTKVCDRACELIDQLKKETQVRILLATIDKERWSRADKKETVCLNGLHGTWS